MEGRLAATALIFTIVAACSKVDLKDNRQLSIPSGAQQNLVSGMKLPCLNVALQVITLRTISGMLLSQRGN